MRTLLGADPGGSGALALLSEDGVLLELADMPTLPIVRGSKTIARVDAHGLAEILEAWKPTSAWMEQVGGLHGDAPDRAFNFGHATGVLEALIRSCGASLDQVTPSAWRRSMGLVLKAPADWSESKKTTARKRQTRAKAVDLFPSHAKEFTASKDGRSDAAVIAEYGRREMLARGWRIFG